MTLLRSSQIRAGRGLIGWTTSELAQRAGLSYPTTLRAERGDGVPVMKTTNLERIERALTDAGVEFIDEEDGGVGVRLRARPVKAAARKKA